MARFIAFSEKISQCSQTKILPSIKGRGGRLGKRCDIYSMPIFPSPGMGNGTE